MLQTANILTVFALIAMMTGTTPLAASNVIKYVDKPIAGAFVLDTRLDKNCSKASLPGARCLPAKDFLAGHKRLANVSGLLWLLGTVGLRGQEHVLVIGDRSGDKEFVAGLLYIAGQAKVSVLAKPLSKTAGDENRREPGISRSSTRESVYQASMRDKHIVLRSELAALIQADQGPALLDGRTDREYWGSIIRATRGGHIPGAQSLPLRKLRPLSDKAGPIGSTTTTEPVVYGHDSYEGLIYLARLVAAGLTPKLYLEGWTGWATDGALPADAASYPVRATMPPKKSDQKRGKTAVPWSLLTVALLSGIALASGGFWLAKRSTRT